MVKGKKKGREGISFVRSVPWSQIISESESFLTGTVQASSFEDETYSASSIPTQKRLRALLLGHHIKSSTLVLLLIWCAQLNDVRTETERCHAGTIHTLIDEIARRYKARDPDLMRRLGYIKELRARFEKPGHPQSSDSAEEADESTTDTA